MSFSGRGDARGAGRRELPQEMPWVRGRSRPAGRGASLVELMVVMVIFLIAISAILSFYIYSRRAYRFTEEASQFERNSTRLMDLLEREIPPSRVLAASGNYVVYQRMKKGDLGGPLVNGRFPEFETENTALFYEDDCVVQRTGTRETRLFTMGLDGAIVFGLSATGKELLVTISGRAKNAQITRRTLSVSNRLVLINSTRPR